MDQMAWIDQMAARDGKPKRVERYGVETWEDGYADGVRRERSLCRHCALLKRGERDNCTVAAIMFGISTTKGFAACVTRCADFTPKESD